MKRTILYMALCLCSFLEVVAQPLFTKQKVMIGDTLTYLAAKKAMDSNTYFPESILVKSSTVLQNGKSVFVIQPFQYGTYTFTDSNCIRDSFMVKNLASNQLFVDTPVIDFNKDIKPIFIPQEKRDFTKIIWGGILVVLLLAALIYALTWYQKRKKAENIFLKSLQKIKDAHTIQDATASAENIQEALKYYLDKRIGIPVLSGTNAQTLALCKFHPIVAAYFDDLKEMFQKIEAAKFAKYPLSDITTMQTKATTILQQIENKKVAIDIAAKQQQKQERIRKGR